MIPKIIHYIWLGPKKKPELVENCIKSWQMHCPDYEIKEWNDENTKEIENPFFKEALKHEKWAFASDYLRLYVLAKHGGFYCDSDLEITQSLDEFRNLEFLTGFEKNNSVVYPVTALMGCVSQQKTVLDLLSYYENRHFIRNREMDTKTNTTIISEYFESRFKLKLIHSKGDTTVNLSEKEKIFPSFYFCTPEENQKNYTIHHFNGSWIDSYDRVVIFSIGKLHLFRLRRQRQNGNPPSLRKNEKLLLSFSYRNNARLVWLTWL